MALHWEEVLMNNKSDQVQESVILKRLLDFFLNYKKGHNNHAIHQLKSCPDSNHSSILLLLLIFFFIEKKPDC